MRSHRISSSPGGTTNVALIAAIAFIWFSARKAERKSFQKEFKKSSGLTWPESRENHGFEAIKISGVEDHAHALLLLPATVPLAKATQILKACSSKWLNETDAIKNVAWQEGYGAFSVSASQTADVIRYIERQREHHSTKGFEEEFLALLKKYGVKYDPEHVLG